MLEIKTMHLEKVDVAWSLCHITCHHVRGDLCQFLDEEGMSVLTFFPISSLDEWVEWREKIVVSNNPPSLVAEGRPQPQQPQHQAHLGGLVLFLSRASPKIIVFQLHSICELVSLGRGKRRDNFSSTLASLSASWRLDSLSASSAAALASSFRTWKVGIRTWGVGLGQREGY